jgi:hypothetical protein
MYDQDECAERAIGIIRDLVEGEVAHARSGGTSRFTVPSTLRRFGEEVPVRKVVDAIEGEGFQTIRVETSEIAGRIRIEAIPANTETFIVERIGTMSSGAVVIMQMFTNRIVRFDPDAAFDERHLALTRKDDRVTTFTSHRSDRITGFRNLSLEELETRA